MTLKAPTNNNSKHDTKTQLNDNSKHDTKNTN